MLKHALCDYKQFIIYSEEMKDTIHRPNGAVANGLVGTEFTSRYRLQPRDVFLKAQ